jgi:hypothetical protein
VKFAARVVVPAIRKIMRITGRQCRWVLIAVTAEVEGLLGRKLCSPAFLLEQVRES